MNPKRMLTVAAAGSFNKQYLGQGVHLLPGRHCVSLKRRRYASERKERGREPTENNWLGLRKVKRRKNCFTATLINS